MRITQHTRFPHPVLSERSGDYSEGEFSVDFAAKEIRATGALTLQHRIAITEPSIRDLVERGNAVVGCFVRCGDTYFTDLRPLSWPEGRSEFTPGSLLNRVTLQPIVWLKNQLTRWHPPTLHPEFEPPVEMVRGDIIAVAAEHVMSVGQAKFAPLESIFELRALDSLPEGHMSVNLDGDRIAIQVSPDTFEAITLLRGQANGKPVVMNSVYLPALMEVLDVLRTSSAELTMYRWYETFMAKCDANGIDLGPSTPILQSAQRLLAEPLRTLSHLVAEAER